MRILREMLFSYLKDRNRHVDIIRTNEYENDESAVPGIITCYRTLHCQPQEWAYIILI